VVPTTQSQRSAQDIQAPLGVGTTRAEERVLAAFGLLSAAPIQFEVAEDVPQGGVLCALPALLELGLLRHSRKDFTLPAGFYPLETIFLVMAFLALARVRSLEALRYEAPGEWGKVLGLDRVPEVKTLRGKLEQLCADEPAVRRWSSTLAQEWMKAEPQSAGTLYIDGHVRVYHGGLTELPRRYVARQRLCLRGTTDYWVNAMDGRPFFVVTQAVDPGLIKVLEEQIVPRLKTEVPGQPTAQRLSDERWVARFTVIFDRAGYSPEFFQRLWEQRIAIITYHKFPQGQWDPEEFTERTVRLSNGLWAREIRHLDETGHQTAILSTDYVSDLGRVAAALFARWCQENFFQYMATHYGLDRLIEYGTEGLPDTTVVVNPAWRQLDQAVRRERAVLVRQQAHFGAMRLPADADGPTTEQFERDKGEQLQRWQQQEQQLEALKQSRKANPKHIALKDLPEGQRFAQLRVTKKHFVDTIKLIAYRAETVLVQVVREKLVREDDARALVRQVLTNTVDLRPNLEQKTLTVRLHRLTAEGHDTVMVHLCEELTATETVYPGTDLRLIFEPVGATLIPPGQDA
jgi:hypothetical protein